MTSVPRLLLCCCMVLGVVVSQGVVVAQRAARPTAQPVAPSTLRPGRIRVISTNLSEMVEIPAGAFEQGYPEDEDRATRVGELCVKDFGPFADVICIIEFWEDTMPNRQIHLSRYFIDRYEVTVQSYRQCVQAGKCDVGALLFGDQRYNKRDWPIVNVTWSDASNYCAWRGKRLPTDAEWEKAARGTNGNLFPWGEWGSGGSNHGKLQDEEILLIERRAMKGLDIREHYVSDLSDGHAYPAKAGQMIWGDSPYGVANMAGNVKEWVADYYGRIGYGDLPTSNPFRSVPIEGSVRSTRGGSWQSSRVLGVTFYRRGHDANTRNKTLGFRCAR